MNKYEFLEAVRTRNYANISLVDVRNACAKEWINLEDAEIIAGIILDC